MDTTTQAYLYDAVRSPFGRFGGALASVRPDDLVAATLRAVVERSGLDPAAVDEVVLGNANGAGEENRNVARMASLLAGLPVSVPGATINRLCGSSLDAAMVASRMIQTGDADIVLTGGVESMTRAPWVLPKPQRAFPAGDAELVSTTLGWRLVNPQMPEEWTVSLGESNEQLQEIYGISRDRQDEFAARSHQLAQAAWESGFYDDLVVPVPGVDLSRDETIRPDSTAAALASLKPSFRKAGTITAGNASPLSDGASAVLLGSAAAADQIGRDPIARIAGRGTHAVEPHRFGYAPVEAANKALARAGIGWSDVGAVELNEAFAVQSLVCLDAWQVEPGDRQHPRWRHRPRPPAGCLRRPHPRHPRRDHAHRRPPLGRRRHLHRRRAGARRRARERGGRVSTTHLTDADAAVADIEDGATVLIGGFGTAGQPVELIDALRRHGAQRPDRGQQQRRQRRHRPGRAARRRQRPQDHLLVPATADSWVFDALYRAGKIELEVVPQGNLAERMRAAGAGIGAFFCPTGVGTPLAEGKETRTIDGRDYVLEYPIRGDVALIRAHRADRMGNLVYRKTARNFGPVMATAATTTIVQVVRSSPTGAARPGDVVTPGIYVDRVVHLSGVTELAQEGAAG